MFDKKYLKLYAITDRGCLRGRDLAEQVGDILAGARASAARAERITHVMEEIHDEGKHVAAETESVSAVSEEQSAAMDEVAEASRKLSEDTAECSSEVPHLTKEGERDEEKRNPRVHHHASFLRSLRCRMWQHESAEESGAAVLA